MVDRRRVFFQMNLRVPGRDDAVEKLASKRPGTCTTITYAQSTESDLGALCFALSVRNGKSEYVSKAGFLQGFLASQKRGARRRDVVY